MKHFILSYKKLNNFNGFASYTFPDLQATIEGNNFGDQIITFIFRTEHGERKEFTVTNFEGSHVTASEEALLKYFKAFNPKVKLGQVRL